MTASSSSSLPGNTASAHVAAHDDAPSMSGLGDGLAAAGRILGEFYADLGARRVGSAVSPEDVLRELQGSIGEEGVGLDAALADVEDTIVPASMAIPHPKYLGLLNTSPMVGGIVADALIAGLNNNAGAWEQSPAFSAAEAEAIACLNRVLGLPAETEGLVLPGGSFATLHGLQLARQAMLPEWREHGVRSLSGNPRVYVTEGTHFSTARAAHTLGVARHDVVRVPATGRGQMDVAALARLIADDRAAGAIPMCVVATIGTTGTGATDPVPEVAAVCRDAGVWLHVDACYGGAAALLEECDDLFAGLDQADSVAIDPHKWFFVPLVAGVILTRHRGLSFDVFNIDAPYIPTRDLIDGFQRGLPTSRRAAGFAIWMTLRVHGLRTIRDAVRRNNELTRRLEVGLRDAGFRVMPDGRLSIACARWEPRDQSDAALDGLQQRIADAAVAKGFAWFSITRSAGQTWLRLAMVNIHTRASDVDELVRDLAVTAAEVAGTAEATDN